MALQYFKDYEKEGVITKSAFCKLSEALNYLAFNDKPNVELKQEECQESEI